MTITYGITEGKHTIEGTIYTSYGIIVYDNAACDNSNTGIASIQDITSDKNKLLNLLTKLNTMHLSIIHLNDIIEDYLETD